MSFTDEDLKRLKETPHLKVYGCYQEENGDHVGSIDVLETEKFEALLARLEAAEKVADLMYSMPPIKLHSDTDRSNVIIQDAQEAWRKAAGK